MKKISIKIIIMNLLTFTLLFGSFFFISIQSLQNAITEETSKNLAEQTNNWAKEFDSLITISSTYVLPLKAYLQGSLSLEILKNDQKSKKVFDDLSTFAYNTVKEANILDLYCWLSPEVVDNIFGLSTQNYSLDGNVRSVNPPAYTRSDISGSSWAWFYNTEKYGTNITKPYIWEGIEGPVISYTERLVVENRTVGVVGTDFKAGNFQKRLLDKKILKSGYFALADEELEFIFHPKHPGESIVEAYPGFSTDDFTKISNTTINSGILKIMNGNDIQLISYKRLFNGWYLLGFPTTSEIYANLNKLTKLLMLVLIIAIIIVTVSAIIVGLSISKPVKEVTKNLEEIANGGGDLTAQIEVRSKDETSILAFNFNKFIQNLRNIVKNIKGSAENTDLIGNKLCKSSSNASNASIEITKNISFMEDSMNKLNNNVVDTTSGIEEIGANISQFKNQIEDQVSAVEESSSAVEQMISSLENVSRVTNLKLDSTKRLVDTTRHGEMLLTNTNQSFKEGISDKIEIITDMVTVIANISERTNLLAMNAAIEAAHAGDAGKGFAVVADEIRKMAEESSVSSKAISEVITTIVGAIQTTDGNMDATSNAFKAIHKEVNEINRALKEIASNTIELSTGGQEILKSVSLLNDTTSQISMGIKEIEEGSTSITDAMMNIQNISSQVLSSVHEITLGVKNVSTSFKEVSELASELSGESEKLITEFKMFVID